MGKPSTLATIRNKGARIMHNLVSKNLDGVLPQGVFVTHETHQNNCIVVIIYLGSIVNMHHTLIKYKKITK